MNLKWCIVAAQFTAIFSFSLHTTAQQSKIDSLLETPALQRDTFWIDQALKASFRVVYNDPPRSEKFLRTVYAEAQNRHYDRRKIHIRLNQGIAKDVMNQPDSAIYYYELGLILAVARKDTAMMASAYNNIGLIHWNREFLDSALTYYRLSEHMFETVGNVKGLTSTLNNMGLIHQSMLRLDESNRYFRRVLKIAEANNLNYFKAIALHNIATSHSTSHFNDSALIYVRQAIPLQIETNDLWGLAKSYHTLGTTYNHLDSLSKAKEAFLKAVGINTQLDNAHALASNYYNIGAIYRKLDDKANELLYLQKAIELENAYSDVELANKVRAFYNLVRVRGWNETIGTELTETFSTKDSIYESRLEGRVLELQEAYEADKREKELVIQRLLISKQEQKAMQRERLIWALVGLLALLLLFGFLFLRYRARLSKLTTRHRLSQERSRISRDLHDNIGAQLTAMSTRMDLLTGKENQTTELEQIRNEASDTVSMLRDTIWAIHREEFSVAQFIARIGQYANRVLPDSTELQLYYDASLENHNLNSSQALNLFRITQEGIQNSMKHSGASKIDIAFERNSNGHKFSISDNGRGCKITLESHNEGYGLQNIRERTSEMNGSVEFSSEVGRGFAVFVSF